jgi:hypothetical protein
MPQYRIVALEIHTRNHYVTADNRGEAIVKYLNDDIDSEPECGSEFSEMADREGQGVRDLLEDEIDQDIVFEKASDMLTEEALVPAVWAIHEVQ